MEILPLNERLNMNLKTHLKTICVMAIIGLLVLGLANFPGPVTLVILIAGLYCCAYNIIRPID